MPSQRAEAAGLSLITTPPDVYIGPSADEVDTVGALWSVPNVPSAPPEFAHNEQLVTQDEIRLIHEGMRSLIRYRNRGLERPTTLASVGLYAVVPRILRDIGLHACGSLEHRQSETAAQITLQAKSRVSAVYNRESCFVFQLPGRDSGSDDPALCEARRFLTSRRAARSHLRPAPGSHIESKEQPVTALQARTAFHLLRLTVNMPMTFCQEIPDIGWTDILRGLREVGLLQTKRKS
ncbi:MAG TPA: hypothetical protein VF733_02820 [Candidatus Saccharimonadales bacterium]